MTLVLPFCNTNQAVSGSQMKLPCVFDGEPLDFESSLMDTNNWSAIKSISAVFEEDCHTTPSDNCDRSPCKRKYPPEEVTESEDEGATESKKPCPNDNATPSSLSLSFSDVTRYRTSPDCSSRPDEEPSVSGTSDEGEDLFLPRRRFPQMWNSRQRWKDERKKVLKMSVNKLTEIEDPELWLLRSVLINNTIKRLHHDIRIERQAKIRHRQQKIDFFNDQREANSTSDDCPMASSFEDSTAPFKTVLRHSPSDIYDDSSCDEIFGISEDFLRVTIPDRRVSSPISSLSGHHQIDKTPADKDNDDSPMDQSPPAAVTADPSTTNSSTIPSHSSTNNTTNRTQPLGLSSCLRANGVSQCATQFRTNDIAIDGVHSSRAPILDSVVYHSLLASLESS